MTLREELDAANAALKASREELARDRAASHVVIARLRERVAALEAVQEATAQAPAAEPADPIDDSDAAHGVTGWQTAGECLTCPACGSTSEDNPFEYDDTIPAEAAETIECSDCGATLEVSVYDYNCRYRFNVREVVE